MTTLPTTPLLNPTSTSPLLHPQPHSLSSSIHSHLPILILIAGPPCSGKKSVLNALKSKLDSLSHGSLHIAILHLRDFHVPAEDSGSSSSVGEKRDRDMECLASYDLPLLVSVIKDLTARGAGAGGAKAPYYDIPSGTRSWGFVPLSGPGSTGGGGIIPEIILCEGHYLLHPPLLSQTPPLSPTIIKIYSETSPDVRLARRVLRDSSPPHCLPLDYIFDTYVRFGKPAAEVGITPTKVLADIILPKGAEGPGVELIAHGVVDDLNMLGRGVKGRSKEKGVTLNPVGMGMATTLKEADLRAGLAYYETV
ncbi:P-loop containing nucleoside triphosphate hydrolase protein [Terfezia boudieri ATCC MYA-4762]|uniref:P-loop containing nucleoside triphosphate hydrolase protein n=1 Tax=Terfezia boudieri ATCC MYA-4762 TaxID=1051890 RepID=A0A3N4LAA0_9PEZI|nr:P-loop containing nucleoside triphosphate hydrolase protein [Terfezia boudieri ATCC MYA-4762]